MSSCKICNKGKTGAVCIDDATNICAKCKDTINNGDYEVIINNNNDVSYDDKINKNDISTPIIKCTNNTTIASEYESNNEQDAQSIMKSKHILNKDNYKEALLASLYSQVEFLRNELEEKNLLLRTLIIRNVQNYSVNLSDTRLSSSPSSSLLSNSTCGDQSVEDSIVIMNDCRCITMNLMTMHILKTCTICKLC